MIFDDSIVIGMPQGKIIKRQRLPKNEQDYYSLSDLYCGAELMIYGKVFRITNCDAFTAKYCATAGHDVGSPETLPYDAYSDKRKRMMSHERAHLFDPVKLSMRKFLANDRKVLRFYGLWDDRQSLYGEIHKLVLRYFLVDDTIEVRELVGPNSGIEPFYLRRIKLPKYFSDLNDLKMSPYYTDEDFEIGSVINVFGRPVELHDCDQFTRNYYGNMGREMNPMSEYRWDGPGGETSAALPPYNGFGSEEDSVGNCILLMPKPPRKDIVKMITHDHKVLRFVSRMHTTIPEDKDRRFIVSYYLADDTVGVYEPPQRNSGVIGGKFLERRKMKHHSENRYVGLPDFYVGAIVHLVSQSFVLLQADEYTLTYMEDNMAKFPHSDYQQVINNIRRNKKAGISVVDSFRQLDKSGSGSVSYDNLRNALRKIMPSVVDQDVLTIARKHDHDLSGTIPYAELVSILQ
eukprot:TRINITY_DN1225_c0_g2_i3.p1 TRINITY_DN1225_c0_g2~~TRINITY_DN1225_c0_g2_i3.p1  ORF type:complete len:460 (+),score=83.06 TRINITY_DN1225_c0_g2_i3:818-2197(+)